MSYCLNSGCHTPHHLDRAEVCHACGTALLLNSRYLALRVIGQNRFSKTFLAIDCSQPNRSSCVIKQVFLQKETTLFQQEAMRLKELGQHDQIPTLLDALEDEDDQYLIQEFIDGENLAEELKSGCFSEIKVHSLL
ncbi:MAG: protein kinase [Timaviella obliquedivisa GSE-PSE-MK23-08B]|jgi:serine/threonine protein kinase|nr:protein kinase [Timaviella obliquedivisa GSE-PSE-MK23-08B]